MKKNLGILACVLCVATLAACGGNGSNNSAPANDASSSVSSSAPANDASNSNASGGNILSNIGDAIGDLISGDTKGTVGKAYHTQWFAFRVDSIEHVAEYAGYTAAEGNELVDVVVTIQNIFGDPIPMGTFDFYLDSDTFLEYEWPMNPLDETMMPEEYELADDEERTYHMVYEVPTDLSDLTLYYTEIDENNNVGATFSIPVE